MLFYCQHPLISIRKQAAIACCALLVRVIVQMDREQQRLAELKQQQQQQMTLSVTSMQPQRVYMSFLTIDSLPTPIAINAFSINDEFAENAPVHYVTATEKEAVGYDEEDGFLVRLIGEVVANGFVRLRCKS